MPLKSNKLKPNKLKEVKEASPKKSEKKKGNPKKLKVPSPKKRIRMKELDPRMVRIIGFFLILVSVYMILAITSFFINWFGSNPESFVSRAFGLGNAFSGHTALVRNWTGKAGAFLSLWTVQNSFGVGAYFLAVLMFAWGLKLLAKLKIFSTWVVFQIIFMGMLWLPMALNGILPGDPVNIFGGLLGQELNVLLVKLIGNVGLVFFLIFVPAIFVLIKFKFKLSFWKKDNVAEAALHDEDEEDFSVRSRNGFSEDKYNTVEFSVSEKPSVKRELEEDDDDDDFPEDISESNESDDILEPVEEEVNSDDIELTVEQPRQEEKAKVIPGEHKGLDTEFDPTLDLPDFLYPGLDLLSDYNEDVKVDQQELEANKKKIVETLDQYSIAITKIKATIGPTVTLYEIIPAPGIRIAKIRNLEDDIALSLAAMGIRIIAPIPGKGTVGIEVPNKNPTLVSMRSIFESEKFQHAKMELPLGLGKTIANESYVVDLTKMPHILIAGATGQGKSVGLNAIIASLLYKKHPSELKFVLVDPKKVELTLYSRIERHYLAKLPDSEEAIITDTRKVVRTLNSLSIEMDNRYELLKDAQVRNIKEYNIKFKERKLNPLHGHRFLPYLVLVVDEFADLIMTAGKEVESPITRLAQLARAVGIHLIIATQRPSVNIITGTIKANFPARIAFRVISKIDSRTILDSSGADQLVGRGDMLMSTGNDLIRLQCAFIDTDEVERVTDFIGQQRAYPDALHLPEYYDEENEPVGEIDLNERDELFEDAARIIVQTQQGSTSLLQRKLKLGYNRAGRIIDQLEAAGIVGPFEGSKAREVRVANEMALEQFLKDLNMKNNDIQ
ncbi:MAG: DNA translocase FtsK 4TM domain-containing protein [Bacteroidales bacterium]|nr:DNA translocase FtsK 4TM domain-containing protein [Bacteroidales bacterium]